jgi:Fe2+-dicitrate sensor, membrane component
VCTIWLDKMTSVPSSIDSIMAVKRPSGGTNTDIQLILSEKENLKIAGKESQLKYTKNGKFSINSNVEQKLDDGEDTYNQLIVPAGKRSSIIFSDGTRMDVNANTRVVYPVVFSHNKREIYVEGEVYLQVSPDKSRPFIVRTDRMDVQVLGTAFDVCTNPDRTLSTVVLVHGKVWVQTSDKQQKILNPGEMLSYIDNNEIGVRNVDVSEYISWAEGYYEFHKEPIRNIVNKLTRYYGKKIAIASELLNITFSGKLDLRDDLQDVLESIAGTMPADVITTKDGGYQLGRD